MYSIEPELLDSIVGAGNVLCESSIQFCDQVIGVAVAAVFNVFSGGLSHHRNTAGETLKRSATGDCDADPVSVLKK